MRLVDCAGYIASLLVFLTFTMKDMVPLRVVALFSNVAFLAYGGALHLWPVILLHGALIPINIWRLAAAFRPRETAQAAKAAPPSSPSRSPRTVSLTHALDDNRAQRKRKLNAIGKAKSAIAC